jgi:hypothetical protein
MRRPTPTAVPALGLLLAGMLLAGCGERAGTEAGRGAGGSVTPTTSAPSSPTASPASTATGTSVPPRPTLPSSLPTGSLPTKVVPTRGGNEIVVTGVAEPGVERGCVILRQGREVWLLLDAENVPLEVPLRVRGIVLTNIFTTCQQGVPLSVVSVSRR